MRVYMILELVRLTSLNLQPTSFKHSLFYFLFLPAGPTDILILRPIDSSPVTETNRAQSPLFDILLYDSIPPYTKH